MLRTTKCKQCKINPVFENKKTRITPVCPACAEENRQKIEAGRKNIKETMEKRKKYKLYSPQNAYLYDDL